MKFRYLIILLSGFYAAPVRADWECSSELSYKWRKAQAESELLVRWGVFSARGADELAAKRALAEPVEREKRRARESCKKEHENLAGCVAGRYSSMEGTLSRMSFSQRRDVEEAVTADCNSKQGSCGEVTATEPQCVEHKPDEASSSSAASESKSGKKDAGKKK